MGQFDRQVATALRLIQKNGQRVIWRQRGEGISDPQAPWLPVSDITVDNTPFICFLPLESGKEFLMSMGKGEAATGAFYGLMGAQSFAPSLKDTVIRDGIELDIDSIDVLSPNGQVILYTIVFNG